MAKFKSNITPPGMAGDVDLKKEVQRLRRELSLLADELSYVLSHLDSDNFTNEGLREIKERMVDL